MNSLPSFSEFFQDLWGYEPFPWQSMLAERITADHWPRALDLPTASGKTACIDAAIYALATQGSWSPIERTAPRRIWFVVDRRIVVDEAFERASKIAQKLKEAQTGPLKEVAHRLMCIGGTERPLSVARLRGGILRDDHWGRLPSQPAVITSTVDQLGSRLLFRGYGHSQLAAPVFAGLAANDSLILLDEAHCSVPFMQTLGYIERYRGKKWAESPLCMPFAYAILSATPPPDVAACDVFPGGEKERALNHPILRDRLSAAKPAELESLNTRSEKVDPLPKAAAARARTYIEQDGKQRVAVIVNRVWTAWKIAQILRDVVGEQIDVALLTGRLRSYERDRLVAQWAPVLRASSPEHPDKPVVLVSTQCIEVGADFSFDAMVTEAASLDALRQRFGRLNRMGMEGDAPATILIRHGDTKQGSEDPVYGTAIAASWNILLERAEAVSEGRKKRRTIDFGVTSLERRLAEIDDLSPCLAPRQDAPALLPAHLDLLCQTAPRPAIEPDIQMYLHGVGRQALEARVVWRADLDPDKPKAWLETIALCPPLGAEMLSVPLYRLRGWLTLVNGATREIDDAPDVEGVHVTHQDERGSARRIVIWRGRDRSKHCIDAREIAPDDVVVLPASYGIDGLGQSEPVAALGKRQLDLWELCRQNSGKPPAVRLNRAVLAPWLDCPPIKELVDLAEDPVCDTGCLHEAISGVSDYAPMGEGEPPRPPDWLIELLKKTSTRTTRIERHPAGGLVLFARDANPANPELDLFADDDDLLSTAGREVSLYEHTASVECAVDKITERCLSSNFHEVFSRTASWHDAGKLDERFQHKLHQGDDMAAAGAEPLAKSAFIPTSPARRKAIRKASGLPLDFRHEMLSVRLAELSADPPAEDADLFFHLIASHHGHARPFAPICDDREPVAISDDHIGTRIELSEAERSCLIPAHRSDSGVCERFWRLNRRYGWWGLAYLEAMLRLGDWYASVTCLGIVDTPRSSIFYRYRRCVYEWSRNFTSEKAV